MSRKRSLVAVISLLVLALAACGGGEDGDGGETSTEAAGSATSEISITGQDDLKWSKTDLTAKAGEVTVELTCEDAVNHDFVIEELDQEVVACAPGGTETGTVELDPGTYTYYCSVPGHRSAGMEGTLTVQG